VRSTNRTGAEVRADRNVDLCKKRKIHQFNSNNNNMVYTCLDFYCRYHGVKKMLT
jgi:hypothetical protein